MGPLVINGIDFDIRLEMARIELHENIDRYFIRKYFAHIDFVKQQMDAMYGIPKQLLTNQTPS